MGAVTFFLYIIPPNIIQFLHGLLKLIISLNKSHNLKIKKVVFVFNYSLSLKYFRNSLNHQLRLLNDHLEVQRRTSSTNF